jgi:IMP dehydrogenase / GMP reductase domain.
MTLLKEFKHFSNAGADVIVIDTAHGHSQGVIKTIKEIRKNLDIFS